MASLWHSRARVRPCDDPRLRPRRVGAVLHTRARRLGIDTTHTGEQFTEWGDFSLAEARRGSGHARLHIGFGASSRERWTSSGVGTAAGYRSDGEPGPRPKYREDYYGAFLLDPDGNSVEAVHYDDGGPATSTISGSASRTSTSQRFYETIAPLCRDP